MKEHLSSYSGEPGIGVSTHYGPSMTTLAKPWWRFMMDELAPLEGRKVVWKSYRNVLTRPVLFESDNPVVMIERRGLDDPPIATS